MRWAKASAEPAFEPNRTASGVPWATGTLLSTAAAAGAGWAAMAEAGAATTSGVSRGVACTNSPCGFMVSVSLISSA